MRWTKLHFSSQDSDRLSTYDLPWQSSILSSQDRTALKLWYAGALSGLVKWVDREADVYVWHERGSHKIVEVVVPTALFATRKARAFRDSIQRFLASDHDGLTDEEQAYLNVLAKAAERATPEQSDAVLTR